MVKDFVYVQVVLSKQTVEELLRKAHVTSKTDAVYAAVAHYLRCNKAGSYAQEVGEDE